MTSVAEQELFDKITILASRGYLFPTPLEFDITVRGGDSYRLKLDTIKRDSITGLPSMGFDEALKALKDGKRITRAGWNAKSLFAYMVPAASYPVQTGAAKEHFGEGAMIPYRAYFALKTADEDIATWVPSTSDILADDWEVL